MRYRALVLFCTIVFLLNAGCSENVSSPDTEPVNVSEEAIPYNIEIVAEGLNVPWEMVFLDEETMYFTKRPGSLRVIRNGEMKEWSRIACFG